MTNHNLGAPFGQQLYDYPQGADNLNLFTVKLIGLVSPHPGVVINVFLFVTFVLDGAAACLVLRRLGVSPPVSIVCAVLFALLPYHFFRSDSHLFLSSYWSLPLTAYLFIAVLDDRPLFSRRPSGGRVRRLLTPGSLATVGMCLVIASTGLYYAVFGLVMIGAALLLKLLFGRRLRPLLPGLAAFALVLVVLIANLAPTAVYHAQHGGNSAEVHSASQGDSLAMSASYLVLPPLHDRIAPLRHLTERYANVTPPHGYCEQCYESVGTVGDVGLLWLLVIGFGSLAGAAFVARIARIHRWSALGVAVVLAIAVTGGVSSLTRVFDLQRHPCLEPDVGADRVFRAADRRAAARPVAGVGPGVRRPPPSTGAAGPVAGHPVAGRRAGVRRRRPDEPLLRAELHQGRSRIPL